MTQHSAPTRRPTSLYPAQKKSAQETKSHAETVTKLTSIKPTERTMYKKKGTSKCRTKKRTNIFTGAYAALTMDEKDNQRSLRDMKEA